ncbi:PA2817 family protein [Cellvibrio sp.]|uniref:PA2817 family protein n=1 Tax=Cellvibrio sp. TaxID=1965322 RepID=UPI0039648620
MTMNDYDKAYYDFHMRLLQAFITQAKEQPPFFLEDCTQEDKDFFLELSELPHSGGSNLLIQGQHLFCRIVAVYPHLMPLVPRDLLWFFGGDCLHYMPDEEISVFQTLDELRQQANETGEPFSYENERLKSMGLH